MNINDYSCHLYIDGDFDKDSLATEIASLIGGEISISSVRDEFIHFHFARNDIFDKQKSLTREDGFLFSRYVADINPLHEVVDNIEPVDCEIYLDLLIHIIKNLRDKGYRVVAACEYEELIESRTKIK